MNNKNLINHDSIFLVLWSTNLRSTVGVNFTQSELNMVRLPCFAKNIMVGLLFSDGYIIFSNRSKNGRLGLTQSLSYVGYIYFLYNALAHYCPRYPVFTKRFRFGIAYKGLV